MIGRLYIRAGVGLVMLCCLALYIYCYVYASFSISFQQSQAYEVRIEKRELRASLDKPSARVPAPEIIQPQSNYSDSERDILINLGMQAVKQTFRPIFTAQQKDQVMEALRLLTNALDDIGVNYFLYGGSLIGSWRHQDIVPWDDDVDIILNVSSWNKIKAVYIPNYTFYRIKPRSKFYSKRAAYIRRFPWKWPFVDIGFFHDNGTHIYDIDPKFSNTFVYDRKDIMPLSRRSFGSLQLKVPKNTKKVLSQNYNVDICKTRWYSHQYERSINPRFVKSVNCSLLNSLA